jgi:hypothetical protein
VGRILASTRSSSNVALLRTPTLRKNSNLILNLFSLIVQSSIPDVRMVEEQMGGVGDAVGKVRERFQQVKKRR